MWGKVGNVVGTSTLSSLLKLIKRWALGSLSNLHLNTTSSVT